MQICKYQGQVRADIRFWKLRNDLIFPTKVGLNMSLLRFYKMFNVRMEFLQATENAEEQQCTIHLGGGVIMSVTPRGNISLWGHYYQRC